MNNFKHEPRWRRSRGEQYRGHLNPWRKGADFLPKDWELHVENSALARKLDYLDETLSMLSKGDL